MYIWKLLIQSMIIERWALSVLYFYIKLICKPADKEPALWFHLKKVSKADKNIENKKIYFDSNLWLRIMIWVMQITADKPWLGNRMLRQDHRNSQDSQSEQSERRRDTWGVLRCRYLLPWWSPRKLAHRPWCHRCTWLASIQGTRA